MKWSRRWNTLQIYPRHDLNSGGSDLWSNMLLTRPRRHPHTMREQWVNARTGFSNKSALLTDEQQSSVSHVDNAVINLLINIYWLFSIINHYPTHITGRHGVDSILLIPIPHNSSWSISQKQIYQFQFQNWPSIQITELNWPRTAKYGIGVDDWLH